MNGIAVYMTQIRGSKPLWHRGIGKKILLLLAIQDLLCNRGDALRRFRLGALDCETQGTVDGKRCENTKSARHAEHDGVEVLLGELVVLEENAAVSVDVGPGVLGLPVLGKHAGGNLVDEADEVDKLVVLDVLLAVLALAGKAGVGLAKHGVSVAGHHLAAVEGVPERLLYGFLGETAGRFVLVAEFFDPDENLLVCEAVEGSGKTVHASSE